jgi:hypothetical protein
MSEVNPKFCACGNPDGTNMDCERCTLIADNQKLKPQWLPAGVLPDRGTRWLWWRKEYPIAIVSILWGKTPRYQVAFGPSDWQEFETAVLPGDRFAPMPKWEGPKD